MTVGEMNLKNTTPLMQRPRGCRKHKRRCPFHRTHPPLVIRVELLFRVILTDKGIAGFGGIGVRQIAVVLFVCACSGQEESGEGVRGWSVESQGQRSRAKQTEETRPT